MKIQQDRVEEIHIWYSSNS